MKTTIIKTLFLLAGLILLANLSYSQITGTITEVMK